jgi:hypothetical protein
MTKLSTLKAEPGMGRKMRGFYVFAMAIFISHLSLAQTAQITKKNWQQHPEIKAARQIYQSIEAAISSKKLKRVARKFEYCQPGEDSLRILFTDSTGEVSRYTVERGSDDSSITMNHYYDKGSLRFVFITGGAVNGSKLEHRIYFDAKGNRIWEDHRYVKGPGYTFPSVWDNDELIRNPGDSFKSSTPCEEKK